MLAKISVYQIPQREIPKETATEKLENRGKVGTGCYHWASNLFDTYGNGNEKTGEEIKWPYEHIKYALFY